MQIILFDRVISLSFDTYSYEQKATSSTIINVIGTKDFPVAHDELKVQIQGSDYTTSSLLCQFVYTLSEDSKSVLISKAHIVSPTLIECMIRMPTIISDDASYWQGDQFKVMVYDTQTG